MYLQGQNRTFPLSTVLVSTCQIKRYGQHPCTSNLISIIHFHLRGFVEVKRKLEGKLEQVHQDNRSIEWVHLRKEDWGRGRKMWMNNRLQLGKCIAIWMAFISLVSTYECTGNNEQNDKPVSKYKY